MEATYHASHWPNHSEQLGLSVFLKDTLKCRPEGPGIKQTMLQLVDDSAPPATAALFNDTLSIKEQAVLYMSRACS